MKTVIDIGLGLLVIILVLAVFLLSLALDLTKQTLNEIEILKERNRND